MLNMTKTKLDLISGPDMYLFFGKYMRGGVSYISNRYSKANKKYLDSYGSKQDSNTLYRWRQVICMAMQFLKFFKQMD